MAEETAALPTRYEHPEGMAQVLMLDVMFPAFVAWLGARDLHLFRLPDDEDDPRDFVTYGVRPGESLMRAAQEASPDG